ncbi:hypothetical protein AA309_01005 [Microvirga vignae]|uniref:Uncharacterized protein n=1 Tax=Microvirga vignae TaxID=1225564 RepID=A0A0H1RJ16_9HYPH|nr:hypothetical protein [Microvirga vignae]KLK94816.1 hypothetical protein AA309_01005 [Microvirga vignae]
MGRYAFIALFSILGLLFPGGGISEGLSLQKIEALSQGALPEIREFITRKLGCSHWESRVNRERLKTAEVKRAVKHLRCGALEEDEAFLRKAYSGHTASINALDTAGGMRVSVSNTTAPPVSAVSKPTHQPAPADAGF